MPGSQRTAPWRSAASPVPSVLRRSDISRSGTEVKISFGCDQRTYATSSKTIDTASAYLEKIKERLRGVNIEHKDFADLIRVYDRKNALFYLDPPYVGTEGYYESSQMPL